MHGVWLLLVVAALGPLLEVIPVAALAAVLVYIGFKLVNIQAMKQLRNRGRGEVMIYASTVVVIVMTSLLVGLAIGRVLSLLHLSWKLSHLESKVTDRAHGRTDIELRGSATFVALPTLARALEALDPTSEVHVYLGHLAYVDHACFEHFSDWEQQRAAAGGTLFMEWAEMHKRAERPKLRPAA